MQYSKNVLDENILLGWCSDIFRRRQTKTPYKKRVKLINETIMARAKQKSVKLPR